MRGARPRRLSPCQSSRCRPLAPARTRNGRTLALLIIFACALIVTGFAAQAMLATFQPGGINAFEWAAVILFTLNFAGFRLQLGPAAPARSLFCFHKDDTAPLAPSVTSSRTALVIALYNESAAKVMGSAEAMWKRWRISRRNGFEVFFLSDTTDPNSRRSKKA